MLPSDFIFDNVYKIAKNIGCSEKAAHDAALAAINDFKKNKFNKASDLIKKCVDQAKKNSKPASRK